MRLDKMATAAVALWEDHHNLPLREQPLGDAQALTVALAPTNRKSSQEMHDAAEDGNVEEFDFGHVVGDARDAQRRQRNINPGDVIERQDNWAALGDVFDADGMQASDQRADEPDDPAREGVESRTALAHAVAVGRC